MSHKSGAIVRSRPDSQQNVFSIEYLGRCPVSSTNIGEGIFQSALFDMYVKYKTSKKTCQLPNANVVLTGRGLRMSSGINLEEFFPIENIVHSKAVIFTGTKSKINGSKVYKYSFENLAELGRGQILTTSMPKTFKYLFKNKHPPLTVFLLKREMSQNILEIHAFVCKASEQALTLSYSIVMARNSQAKEAEKASITSQTSNINNHYASQAEIPQYRNETRNQPSIPDTPSGQGDNDLPHVMKLLGELGAGKGEVVSSVIRTENVNLINDQQMYLPSNKYAPDKSQRSSTPFKSVRVSDRQSRVLHLNQNDFTGGDPQYGVVSQSSKLSGHNRSSSCDQLNYLAIFQEDVSYRGDQEHRYQNNPVQKNKSFRHANSANNFQSPGNRSTSFGPPQFPQNMVSNNPSGEIEKLNKKPVAMVQPHKISGIKVFPQGYDRTGLIPEKDKLKRRKTDVFQDLSLPKGVSPTKSVDVTGLFGSNGKNQASGLSKVENKPLKTQFVLKSSTEEQIRKLNLS